jgi:hypothetical protein
MCSETGGVPPWSHHTAKRDWLSALGGIGCEVLQDDAMADFSNRGTAVPQNATSLCDTTDRAWLFCAPDRVPYCCRAARQSRNSCQTRARCTKGNDWQSPACRVSVQTPLSRCCKLLSETPWVLHSPDFEMINVVESGWSADPSAKKLAPNAFALFAKALGYHADYYFLLGHSGWIPISKAILQTASKRQGAGEASLEIEQSNPFWCDGDTHHLFNH